MRKRTVKWPEKTFAQEAELMEAFSPYAETPSRLSRIVYDLLYTLVRTRGTVALIAEHLKGCSRPTLSAQLEFDFAGTALQAENLPAKKALGRVQLRGDSLGRRIACIGLTRRYAALSGAEMARLASFPGRIRPSFSNSTALWRAA